MRPKGSLRALNKFNKRYQQKRRIHKQKEITRKWRLENEDRERKGLPPLPHPKSVAPDETEMSDEAEFPRRAQPKSSEKPTKKLVRSDRKPSKSKKVAKAKGKASSKRVKRGAKKSFAESKRKLGMFRGAVQSVLCECNPEVIMKNILRRKYPTLERARFLKANIDGWFPYPEDVNRAVELGTTWLWPKEPQTAVFCRHDTRVLGNARFVFRNRKACLTAAFQDALKTDDISVRNRPHLLGLVIHIHSGLVVNRIKKKKPFEVCGAECQINTVALRPSSKSIRKGQLLKHKRR